jgi:hypothetical protein
MRTLSTLRPTQNQQLVMALISSLKDKPAKAAVSVSTGQNMVAARNMLMKLGVITYTNSHAALTATGEQLAKDYDIIDDAGSLTDNGNQLLAAAPGYKPQPQNQQVPQPTPDQVGMNAGGDFDIGSEPGMESFSNLFKTLLLS